MPSRKQFATLKLEVPFRTEMLDMFQVTDIINNNIKNVLKYIDQNKIACFEVPEIGEGIIHIKRIDEIIVVKHRKYINGNSHITEKEFKEGIDFLNWLYKYAPSIEVVGISNGEF
jgi:hypothetical protein